MAKETSARSAAVPDASRGESRVEAPSWKRAKLAIALAIAVFAAVSALVAGTRPACIDYYEFWVVGRAVRGNRAGDIYTDAERARLGEVAWNEALSAQASSATPDVPSKRIQAAGQRRVLETYSTPWMYTLLGLASTGDYDADQARFEAFSTLVFLLAIAAFGRLLGYSALRIALCAWFFTSTWFKPFSDELIAGNVNRIQVAFLAAFAWIASRARWKHRDVAAGAVLGAAILFKPNLAPVAVVLALGWWITRRRAKLARQAIGAAIGAAAAVLISSAWFGSISAWSSWLRTIPELMSQGATAGGNYALARLLLDRFGVASRGAIPLVLAALAVIALVLRVRRDTARHASEDAQRTASEECVFDVALVGIGAAIAVLATELVWLHYYILFVPLALFAWRPRAARARFERPLAVATALFAGALIGLQVFVIMFAIPRPSAASPYVNAGALLLLVVSSIDLALGAPATPLARGSTST